MDPGGGCSATQSERAAPDAHVSPAVPVPGKFGRLLDETTGFFVTVDSVRKAFEAMLDELSLRGSARPA